MERASDSLVTWTKVVYALHAFSLLTGILGTSSPSMGTSPRTRTSFGRILGRTGRYGCRSLCCCRNRFLDPGKQAISFFPITRLPAFSSSAGACVGFPFSLTSPP